MSQSHRHFIRIVSNKDSHDQLVKECTSRNIPTILHVYNSSIPSCQAFLLTFESWVKTSSSHNDYKIQVGKMDYTSETSFMFKFAPNQLPITVFMVGQGWARTVTGTDIRDVEKVTEGMMGEYRRLTAGQ